MEHWHWRKHTVCSDHAPAARASEGTCGAAHRLPAPIARTRMRWPGLTIATMRGGGAGPIARAAEPVAAAAGASARVGNIVRPACGGAGRTGSRRAGASTSGCSEAASASLKRRAYSATTHASSLDSAGVHTLVHCQVPHAKHSRTHTCTIGGRAHTTAPTKTLRCSHARSRTRTGDVGGVVDARARRGGCARAASAVRP